MKGTDNILGGAVSRNPKDRDAARDAPFPGGGAVKRAMRLMFERPIDNEAEWDASSSLLETLDTADVDRPLAQGGLGAVVNQTHCTSADPHSVDASAPETVKKTPR